MKTICFTKRTKRLSRIFSIAENLEKKLSWVPDCTNGMDRIVEFFQITSSAQDQFAELAKNLEFKKEKEKKFFLFFSKFLDNVGRCEYGWNRTKKGEIPSSSTIFINMKVPYDEMFYTKNVAEHLSRRNNPKGEIDYALKESTRGKWNETGLIENEFVNPFMKDNYKFLQEVLKKFREK